MDHKETKYSRHGKGESCLGVEHVIAGMETSRFRKLVANLRI